MKQKLIEKKSVMRGSRKYLEVEGSNHKYTSIISKLENNAFKNLSKKNNDILLDFLKDLEAGKYVSKNSRKGGRSFKRLIRLFYSLRKMASYLKCNDLTKVKEEQLEKFFEALNKDKIVKKNGEPYKDKRDFKRDFSSFWHWYMIKTYKLKKERLDDITEYITTPKESKPKFMFFTLEDLKEKILQHTNNEDLKAVLLILFDMGARPSEFYNIRKNDITYSESDKKYMVEIPEEISKTFGRKIKLWLSSSILEKYLKRHNFTDNDLLFIQKRGHIKKFLWELAKTTYIKELSSKYGKNITLYDFRHSSACYYLNRYPTAKDMKYRFGWKKESEIEYYTSFLGKQDFLSEEDMLSPEDKTKLERELEAQKKKNEIMRDKIEELTKELKDVKKQIPTVFEYKGEIDKLIEKKLKELGVNSVKEALALKK